ncbi:hypothetical protein ABGB17_05125 [Sphaerisporangium sp. B11E5]|uniref:hypothetical protein n=1 Tax=Sphaerisporangium sp. B11E5 TaxID=3153563 RepID=UPI00325CA955
MRSSGRRFIALIAAVMSALLILTISPTAALADEGDWYDTLPTNVVTNDTPAAGTYNNGARIIVYRNNERLYYVINAGAAVEIPGGARTTAAPTLAMWNDIPVVFHVGTNDRLYYALYINGNWGSWLALPGSVLTRSTPSLTAFNNHAFLLVTFRGTNNHIYTGWMDTSLVWHGGGEIPGATTENSPAVGVYNGAEFLAMHRGTNSRLYVSFGYLRPDGTLFWNNWFEIPGGGISQSRPVATSYGNGMIDVAVRAYDGSIWWQQYSPRSGWFVNWQPVRGGEVSPSAPFLWTYLGIQAVLYIRGLPSGIFGKTLSDNNR